MHEHKTSEKMENKMKKYVFSHISFFDNIMDSKVIESDLDALQVATQEFARMTGSYPPGEENIQNLDDLKNFAFNCDSMIEIIEV